MDFIKRHFKRILTDAAGYLLILGAIATGWLPGPGGLPLAIAGLGLLSINNEWAKRLREWLLENGGKAIGYLFPDNKWIKWAYDFITVLLFVLCIGLEINHAALWQVSLGVFGFCLAGFIVLMNRDRLTRLRNKHKRK